LSKKKSLTHLRRITCTGVLTKSVTTDAGFCLETLDLVCIHSACCTYPPWLVLRGDHEVNLFLTPEKQD